MRTCNYELIFKIYYFTYSNLLRVLAVKIILNPLLAKAIA